LPASSRADCAGWLAGSRLNRDVNDHSLFFIPAHWFGPIFVLAGLGFAGDAVMRDGVTRAHSSFVYNCDRHELGGTPAACECLATRIEKADAMVVVPFYAEMGNSWNSRYGEEDPVQHFMETYLTRVPNSQAVKFADALQEGASCFELPEQLQREEMEQPAPAAEPAVIAPATPT
jgi:hypothetical protein